MMTPQDIREKTFEKAVFGGYDMGDVDDFMEQVAAELTSLQKENSVLKGKMKVLVDKIEEYRGGEEALRTAILSAQKMGNMIEKESREKSDRIVSDAEAEAERLTRKARSDVEAERAKLDEAKRSSARFIEGMNQLCHAQLEFLARLSGTEYVRNAARVSAQSAAAPPADDGSEIHETVKSIEETVAKAATEPLGDVRPDIQRIVGRDNDNPTRAYGILSSSADDDADRTMQF